MLVAAEVQRAESVTTRVAGAGYSGSASRVMGLRTTGVDGPFCGFDLDGGAVAWRLLIGWSTAIEDALLVVEQEAFALQSTSVASE